MSKIAAIIRILLVVQRLVDMILDEVVKRSDAKELSVLNEAIDAARKARTREEKSAAAKRISDAFNSAS